MASKYPKMISGKEANFNTFCKLLYTNFAMYVYFLFDNKYALNIFQPLFN